MTLPVPLTVRVGDQHVTQQVQSLSFREEAVGGVRSISFSLSRPLSDLDGMDPLAKVYIYDARTAETVAEGRLADTGRGAGADGQKWDCVAFGPAQAASDITQPSIFIDRSMSDGWRMVDVVHSDATAGVGSRPGDTAADPWQGVLAQVPTGTAVGGSVTSRVVWRYEPLSHSTDQELGGFRFNWFTGHTSTDWKVEAVARVDGSATANAFTANFDTAGGNMAHTYSSFGAAHNTLDLSILFFAAAATTTGDTWGWFSDVVVRPKLLLSDGSARSAGDHSFSYIFAHDVVHDIVARLLPQFDGPGATIVGNSAYQITQLAYRDGVTAEQILQDLMALEPAYRWYSKPASGAGGYEFVWEPWPTQVRYEATLDDGGSFPLTATELYNSVKVRWVDGAGAQRVVEASKACPPLDSKGIVRRAFVDLGNEAGSAANASQAAAAFLDEHNVPKNSGTLTVARPIRDVITGAMVQPWEIKPGELVRIRGVEAYPDAFNATTNDGQGVFRIHAKDYTSEGNTATLALDADPHDTESALAKLMNERSRN